MGTANAYSNPSRDAEGDARQRGGGTSVVLFERLRDLVGRSPARPQPGAREESSQASAQPRLPGMEAC
jgi:hypothetical protein